MSPPPAAFEAAALSFRYSGAARPALDQIDLRIPAGAFFALLGPNGSGKSTLLRLLLGALIPSSGRIAFEGRPLAAWDRQALARGIGVVTQGEEMVFPITVRELVAMGRYPHLGAWRAEGVADRAAMDEAMDRCDVTAFADRPLATLSGGERQRARIARALAQQPGTLVLDEPTASLDVRHEMAIFELLGSLARGGVTIVLVTHHINLAARFAHELLLLHEGKVAARGSPRHVLDRAILESVYGWPIAVTSHPGPGPDTGAPQVVPIAGDVTVALSITSHVPQGDPSP